VILRRRRRRVGGKHYDAEGEDDGRKVVVEDEYALGDVTYVIRVRGANKGDSG